MTFRVLPYITLFFCFLYHIAHAHPYQPSKKTSSSLKFLDQLIGAKKGDNNVKGIDNLKIYLSYLGHFSYDRNSNHQPHEQDNNFNDPLEIALRNYQQFHNLSVTGILDDNTVEKMQQPRCGMPDYFNPSSHYSFFRGRPRWRMMNLTYSFDWNVREEAKSAMDQALKEWESKTAFKFYKVKNFSRADIKISFQSGDHGDGHPFGGSVLGHSFPPPDGRVHFDNNQDWRWTGKRTGYDFQTAGLHELGHVLGLEHSNVLKAVMYPVLNPLERRGLHKDDIDGIKALYRLRGK